MIKPNFYISDDTTLESNSIMTCKSSSFSTQTCPPGFRAWLWPMLFTFTVCLFQPHKQRLSLLQQRPPILHHNSSSQPPPPPCRRQLGSISGVARAKGTSRTRTGPPLSATEVRPCCPHRFSRPTRVTSSLTPMDLTSRTPRVIARQLPFSWNKL